MSRARFGLTIILVTAAIWGMVGGGWTSPAPRVEAAVTVLWEWEWEAPPYELTLVVGGDGQTYTRVDLNGYQNGGLSGWPSLPVVGELVTLPPEGAFDVELVEVEYETVRLDHPVEPVPAPAPAEFDEEGRPLPGGWAFFRDEAAYTSAAPSPAEFAALDDPVWMRGQRLARLTVAPFRYHPAHQTLDVLHRLRLRVVAVADDSEGGRALKGLMASNGPQVDGSYKIIVPMEGIYGLDYATLAAAGVPVGSINPATLRIVHAGVEVAAQWEGDGDAVFEPGERLVFYARPELTRYAGHDVYWLAWGGAAGQRMTSRSGDPTGLPSAVAWTAERAEKNVEYDSLYPGWNGEHWFWDELKQPDSLGVTFTISLETPDAATPGELTVWLQGSTRDWPEPDHHVRYTWNGSAIHDAEWEGKTAYTETVTLPPGLLIAGDNTLELTLPDDLGGDVEAAWVDVITVTYGLSGVSEDWARFGGRSGAGAYTVGGFSTATLRVYDVTDPVAPRVVIDWTSVNGVLSVGDAGGEPSEYMVLSDDWIWAPLSIEAAKPLVTPPAGADYIIVTHPDFESALAPLAAHRASRGLRVAVVDVEALYDHFGDGRMSPEAIRSFLSYAYTHWPAPAPLYVLLVGDGTYDLRGYRPDSNPTYLPPYLDDVDPWFGETASDHWYADLTGDPLPELLLGRLPVNTAAEAAAVVDKIITYETHPASGGWNRRLLFGADNPSTAGDHHDDADQEFNTYAALPYQGVRVYLSEETGASHLYTSAADARAALIEALDQGALLYTYFGHSSWHQEAVLETDGYAPLFHLDHIADLHNQGRWPLVLHMTCYTSYYIHRTDDTLDETLLRTDGVGAVAVFGSSGNGVTPDHRVLHRFFYRSVMDDGEMVVGAAMRSALVGLYTYGVSYDLIDTYHLLGDPALRLNVRAAIFLPIVMRGA